jgi:hypothetical protein
MYLFDKSPKSIIKVGFKIYDSTSCFGNSGPTVTVEPPFANTGPYTILPTNKD